MGCGLFTQHQPGLQRHPQFQLDAAVLDASIDGKPELKERFIPAELKRIARLGKFIHDRSNLRAEPAAESAEAEEARAGLQAVFDEMEQPPQSTLKPRIEQKENPLSEILK